MGKINGLSNQIWPAVYCNLRSKSYTYLRNRLGQRLESNPYQVSLTDQSLLEIMIFWTRKLPKTDVTTASENLNFLGISG